MAAGQEVLNWIEKHPVPAAAIGGVVVLGVLWWMGFFSSSSSNNSGQTNMAAAYYAAEAQQAVVGGQIQLANISATRDTAIAGIQANAATAIAQTQANQATTINQQNADSANVLGNDQLLATINNNATALASTNNTNYYNYLTNETNQNSTDFLALLQPGGVAAQEIAQSGAFVSYLPSGASASASGGFATPASMRASGFSEQQIANYFQPL